MARSDKISPVRKQEFYSDFLINFDKNPITGVLAKVTNEDSIKQSLKNLILTNRTERFYDPLIGSKIQSLLFEPLDLFTADVLKDEITTTIKNYEPRVTIHTIEVTPADLFKATSENGYNISIVFSTINIPQETRLDFFLSRVR